MCSQLSEWGCWFSPLSQTQSVIEGAAKSKFKLAAVHKLDHTHRHSGVSVCMYIIVYTFLGCSLHSTPDIPLLLRVLLKVQLSLGSSWLQYTKLITFTDTGVSQYTLLYVYSHYECGFYWLQMSLPWVLIYESAVKSCLGVVCCAVHTTLHCAHFTHTVGVCGAIMCAKIPGHFYIIMTYSYVNMCTSWRGWNVIYSRHSKCSAGLLQLILIIVRCINHLCLAIYSMKLLICTSTV